MKFQNNESNSYKILDTVGILVSDQYSDHDSKGKLFRFELVALNPVSSIRPIMGNLQFGSVIADQTMRMREIIVKNVGKAKGTFSAYLSTNTNEIFMESEFKNYTLDAGEDIAVNICFTPSENNSKIVSQLTITSEIDGEQHVIPVVAKIDLPRLTVQILEKQDRNDLVEFGTLYSDTTSTKQVKITNNSPESTTWIANVLRDQVGELMGECVETSAMDALYQNQKERSLRDEDDRYKRVLIYIINQLIK